MTNQEFIKQIATYVKKHASTYGIKVYSPIIAQAILESAYGTSELAVNAHNYFGLKYRAGRCKTCIGVYNKVGSEQNADGSYSSSAMKWCKFADMENGVIGYFDFINISNYSNLKGVTDPRKYLENIKADGYATSLKYVDNLMAVIQKWNLTEYDTKTTTSKEETKMSNSSLVSYTKLSPNHSGARTHSIDRITPHCVVGQLSAESICGCFTSTSRQASCNYGIGTDGRISLCVEEKNRSWCSSSNANDQRAVTIECASDMSEPYAMNSNVYASLIKLCVDICKRNGKTKLIWFGDKTKTLNYSPASNEMVLTVHRWFANKSCPGNWLYARLGDLATQVTKQLGGSAATPTTPSTPTTTTTNTSFPAVPFTVQVLVSDLNIRKGAGMSYSTIGKYTGKGTFTITEVKDGWGHLKSNAGWIYLENASYVKIGSHVGSSSSGSSSGGSSSGFTPYKVRVTASALNIRKGAGTNYATNGCIRDKGVYTIVGEATGKGATKWLRLKSGAGWIASDYTTKV